MRPTNDAASGHAPQQVAKGTKHPAMPQHDPDTRTTTTQARSALARPAMATPAAMPATDIAGAGASLDAEAAAPVTALDDGDGSIEGTTGAGPAAVIGGRAVTGEASDEETTAEMLEGACRPWTNSWTAMVRADRFPLTTAATVEGE